MWFLVFSPHVPTKSSLPIFFNKINYQIMTFSKQAYFEAALVFVRLLWNLVPTSTVLLWIWPGYNFHCGLPNFCRIHLKLPKIPPNWEFLDVTTSLWQQNLSGILLQANKINMVGKPIHHVVPFRKFKRNLVFTVGMVLVQSWKKQ